MTSKGALFSMLLYKPELHSGLPWRKARRCLPTCECVEIAADRGRIIMRDSTDPDGPTLDYSSISFRRFVAGVQDGQFDHRYLAVR